MKICNFLAVLLFFGSAAYGASDRFGNERKEVPRSSFTTTQDINVLIASVTQPNVDFASMTPTSGGSLVLRSVTFSGLIPSTITFFNSSLFDGLTATHTILHYIPVTSGGLSANPVTVDLDIFASTAIAYTKIGLTPVLIKWDWLSPRRSGDGRN